MIKKFNRGFTLIELLVVIAIIGILSSVVLASLNTARGKGADAAIKSNLANIRAQAEIVYDNASPNSYELVCDSAVVVSQLTSAANAGGSVYTAGDGQAETAAIAACHDADGTWVAAVPLKTDSANSWCVDSTGTSKQETGAANYISNVATACP